MRWLVTAQTTLFQGSARKEDKHQKEPRNDDDTMQTEVQEMRLCRSNTRNKSTIRPSKLVLVHNRLGSVFLSFSIWRSLPLLRDSEENP